MENVEIDIQVEWFWSIFGTFCIYFSVFLLFIYYFMFLFYPGTPSAAVRRHERQKDVLQGEGECEPAAASPQHQILLQEEVTQPTPP